MIVIKGPIKTSNGCYLTAVNGGGLGGPDAGIGLVALHSDATATSTWETFTLALSPAGQNIGRGMTFGLITSSAKNYVTAVSGGGIGGPNDGTCPFHTDANNASGWEQFTLNVNDAVNPPTVTIQTANGNYVTAVDGGGVPDSPGGDNATPMRTSDGALQAWQIFTAAGTQHQEVPPAKYNFELNSLQVLSKRTNTFPGTGEDTDFVGFTLTVGNNAPQTITKAMGNLSTSSYIIGLIFEDIAVNPGDNVLFNYHVVNSGQPEQGARIPRADAGEGYIRRRHRVGAGRRGGVGRSDRQPTGAGHPGSVAWKRIGCSRRFAASGRVAFSSRTATDPLRRPSTSGQQAT